MLALSAGVLAAWWAHRPAVPCDAAHAGQLATVQDPSTWHPVGIPDPHYFMVCQRGEDGKFDWLKLDRALTRGLQRR